MRGPKFITEEIPLSYTNCILFDHTWHAFIKYNLLETNWRFLIQTEVQKYKTFYKQM